MTVFANVKREIWIAIIAIAVTAFSIIIYEKNKDNTQNVPVTFEQTVMPSLFVEQDNRIATLGTAYVTLPPIYISGQHVFTVSNLENAKILHVRVIVVCEELFEDLNSPKPQKDKLLHKINN